MEKRLLYYADFYDVAQIIRKNWDAGFKDCFRARKQFDVYMDRLSDFRNPDAHSRGLLPFVEDLVRGMTGELRQAITLYLSSGGGGPEPEHFARIEEVRDSYGTRVTGKAMSGSGSVRSAAVLRPGDAVSFTGRAWDPEGSAIEWSVYLAVRSEFTKLSGHEFNFTWTVEERDISEQAYVSFRIKPARPYFRDVWGYEDDASIHYRVLPRR